MAAPVIGARQEGTSGFFKGLGAGLVSAVVLPTVGVTVGATQVVRGIVNTPEAIAEANAGKRWNHRTREWVREDLVQESLKLSEMDDDDILEKARQRARERGAAPGLEGMMGGGGGGGGGGGENDRNVSGETEFYDVLEVTPSATTGEIKRSYYLMARKLHPDKNPDDPDAKAKFQKIGEAYQVLSDPELRKKYDTRGKDGLGEHTAIDASAFFAVLFGSDQMEGLVGRLQLATLAMAGADLKREELALLQERRQGRLAVKLAAMLEGYCTAGGEEEFKKTMTAMAQQLVKVSYGEMMLHLIGFVYEKQANEFLTDPVAGMGTWADLGFRTNVARLEQHAKKVSTQMAAASAGLKVFNAFRAGEAEAKEKCGGGGGGDDGGENNEEKANEVRARHQQKMLPHFLEALWNASALDIESTLRHVCDKVLHDFSVSKPKRGKRGEALAALGKIFQEVKAPEGTDPMAQVEEAMRRAFQPDDDDDDDDEEKEKDAEGREGAKS